MRREYKCNCHPTNHQYPQLSLTPLDCAKSHNSTENEYYWQNFCKCSNCILYEPQITSIGQSKVFDFDAIQVMEKEELQQLPEAVNREIVKNSEEIVFEEEKVSERNLTKLNDVKNKFLSYNQDILFGEREEDVLIQRAVEKDMINKENKRDNQENLKGEEKDASIQRTLIKLNKDKDKILEDSQKIFLKKGNIDFSEKYMIRLNEGKTDILKNSREIMYEDTKDGFLKRNIIWLNEKDADNMKNYQKGIFKQEEEVLERKLVKLNEGNGDTMKNHSIYEEEQLPFIKVKENPKDIRHLIRHTLYKPKEAYKMRSNELEKKDYEVCLKKRQKLHNKKCQLAMLVNQDQKNIEKNIFMKKERNSQKRFDRSLSDDLLTISDKRSFKEPIRNRSNKLILSINQDNRNSKSDPFLIEKHTSSKKHYRSFTDYFVTTDGRRSKENAISNMKNVRIFEKVQKSLQQIPNYCAASLDHLNSNSIFDQRLNYDSLRWENNDSHCQMKQHDNIRIENEKTLRKSSCHRPAKISIQDKLYSNNIRSLDSPVYDLSPESGFYERSSECNYRELFMRNMKDVKNSNSVESNLSRKNAINDIDNSIESIKNHNTEAIASINNSVRNDEIIASSHFNPSFKNSFDDGNNLVKYADASIIKEQIICVENGEQDIHEAEEKYRCQNRSRKLVSNFDESEKSSSIVEKYICSKDCIQNIDEELTTQKSGFLNVDTSYKHFVKDVECPELFDE